MNGTEKIVARILADADLQVKTALDAAQKAIADESAKVEAECESMLACAKEAAEKNAHSILSRAESAASMDARRSLLLSKAEMLDRAYETAEKAFLDADDDERMRFCMALTARALESVLKEEADLRACYGEEREADAFCVILSEKDRLAFGDRFIGEFLKSEGKDFKDSRVKAMTLSPDGGAFGTGIILSCGEYEHNATLGMLLTAHRNDCEQEVYRLLFPTVS
ncbi:MAG: V-type ATP synthase subunit E [Clostridia bacterium]|nr:V-type ATP synthase subunit E [Clostridia bacterium]